MQRLLTLALSSILALAVACPKAEEPEPLPSGAKPADATPTPPAEKPAEPKPAAASTTIATKLGPMTVPGDNPQTPEKAKLGHQIFFDKRLSVDGSRSCYDCHKNEDGNGGHEPIAIGPGEKKLTRHSPVMWNVGLLPALYWDGRAATLEAQATGALAGGNMGLGKENLEKKAAEIAAIPAYKAAFDAAFPGEGTTAATIAKALSAYERTLVCDNTAYDKAKAGDATAMTPEQKKGEELFNGKAGCMACHTAPFFSTAYLAPTFYNVGIGTQGKPEADVDAGRAAHTKADADWAAFKVPTLRNVAKSAPYFHDGSVAKLEDAVRLMASGGIANKNKTPILVDKQLSDDEVKSIVAFLGALDCPTMEQPTLP